LTVALPPEFESYRDADEDVRKLLRLLMKRRYRQARERYYLNMAGLVTGFIIALAFLAVSGWLINGDHDAAGVILGSVDLVALVSVFVYAHTRLTRQITK
jgi:hypothetical protein